MEDLLRTSKDDPFADQPGHEVGVRRLLEARRQHDTWERLVRIRCPVLICGGRYDGIALPASQERMASRIRGASLRMFEGGHYFLGGNFAMSNHCCELDGVLETDVTVCADLHFSAFFMKNL